MSLPAGSNMLEQIAALEAAGILLKADAGTLLAGAAFVRALDHAVRLVTGRIMRELPGRAGQAEAVEFLLRTWGLITGNDRIDPVQDQLNVIQQKVREVYNRLLGSD